MLRSLLRPPSASSAHAAGSTAHGDATPEATPATTFDMTVEEAYTAPLGRHDDRPWVELCMVSSLDGSTSLDGTSGGLSSPNDTAVLGRLRTLADVVLVGAGTVRDEGYGVPKKDGQRLGVITASGSVDTTSELFTSGAGFVITHEHASFETNGVDVIRAGRDQVDLSQAIRRLSEVCGAVSVVHAEGGPTLNAALAAADLIDELNLTTSPSIVGGDAARLTAGAEPLGRRFELHQLAIDDESFMFSRWLRVRR